MSYQKISQLTEATTLATTDLFLISQDVGGGNFDSKKVTEANLQVAMSTFPKASGKGIKIDQSSPTFGWKDLLGPIHVKGTGNNNPTWATYRGNISQYQFGVGKECWLEFHIPHDYVPGSDLYIHAHWSHIATNVTSGGVTWGWDVSYAKGYNQAAFSATVNPTIQQNASTTQYQHMIAEVQLSSSSPSGTQLNSNNIEIDGLILVRCYLSANTISAANDPFLHMSDLHYQSTQLATKSKNTPFYS